MPINDRRDSRSRGFREAVRPFRATTHVRERDVMLNRLLTLETRLNGSLRTDRDADRDLTVYTVWTVNR